MSGLINIHADLNLHYNALISGTLYASAGSDTTPLFIQINPNVTQTADIFRYRTAAGDVLAKIEPTGKIYGTGLDAMSQRVTHVAAPSSSDDAANMLFAIDRANTILSGHSTATTAHGVVGNIVGTDGFQVLTNKQLDTPIIGDFSSANHDHSNSSGGGTISHTDLDDKGTNTHAQIDSHIAASGLVHGVSGFVVGTLNSQLLANKILNSTNYIRDASGHTIERMFTASQTGALAALTFKQGAVDSFLEQWSAVGQTMKVWKGYLIIFINNVNDGDGDIVLSVDGTPVASHTVALGVGQNVIEITWDGGGVGTVINPGGGLTLSIENIDIEDAFASACLVFESSS